MRVTQSIAYNTYVNDLMRRQEAIYKSQYQLSTGKAVNTPSDDPVKANKLLTSKSVLRTLEQYEKNIDSGIEYLSMAENSLEGAKNIIISIQELAVSAATETMDATSRVNTGTAVARLYDQLVSLANANSDGKYLFSGNETGTEAFSAAGVYQGDANKQSIKIGNNSLMEIGVNGGEVFKGAGGGSDVMQTVSDLVTALNSNDTAGIQASIGTLEASFNQLTNAVADIGGMVNRLNQTKTDNSAARLDLSIAISGLEDADLTKVISDLQLGQVALEASMSSSGKVFSTNIFDYL